MLVGRRGRIAWDANQDANKDLLTFKFLEAICIGYTVIIPSQLRSPATQMGISHRPGVVLFKEGSCLRASLRSPHSRHFHHLERRCVALGERPGPSRPSHSCTDSRPARKFFQTVMTHILVTAIKSTGRFCGPLLPSEGTVSVIDAVQYLPIEPHTFSAIECGCTQHQGSLGDQHLCCRHHTRTVHRPRIWLY